MSDKFDRLERGEIKDSDSIKVRGGATAGGEVEIPVSTLKTLFAGSGSGDLLASNNLSDVANAATSRTNLDVDSSAEVTAKVDAAKGVIEEEGSGSAPAAAANEKRFFVDTDLDNRLAIIDESSNINYLEGMAFFNSNGDETAVNGHGYAIDGFSNTVTLTLPATPASGEKVFYYVEDATNTVTIARNGSSIDGNASDLTPGVGTYGLLVFVGGLTGWRNVLPAAGGGGDLLSTNNLSDLDNAATARTNLGLGTLATQNTVTAGDVDAGASTDGQVLTSDGAGNAAWEAVSGGGWTVNEELLTGNKTLSDGDAEIQILDANAVDRDVTLPATPSEGSVFQITNAQIPATTAYELSVKVGADTVPFMILGAGQTAMFVYENSEWKCIIDGAFYRRTGADTFETQFHLVFGRNNTSRASSGTNASITIGTENNNYAGIAIGTQINAAPGSIAMGQGADSNSNSTIAIGQNSGNATYQGAGLSTAVGAGASALYATAAIGDTADPNAQFQTALGAFVDGTTRYAGCVKNVFATNANVVFNEELGWLRTTTDATITELFLAGVASNRAVIVANSLVSFRLNIVAREAATGDCKVWEVLGAIKRDGSNNTALVGSVTSTVVAADAGASAWAVTVDADDTNEALRIQVTGEAAHTITWAAHAEILDRR